MSRLVTFLGSFLLTAFTLISAQSLTGQWTDDEEKLSVILHENGTFLYSGPEENLVGNYNLQGNRLIMVDTHGRSYQFDIRDDVGKRKILVDSNGRPLTYRQTVTLKSRSPENAGLLAEYGRHQLKESDIDVGMKVIELITEQPLQDTDRDIFIRASIYEFSKSPTTFLQQVEALRNTLDKIRRLSNPIDIGNARQQLLSSFYVSTRNVSANKQPVMMQIIGQYVKFLAYSDSEKLVLTDRDVEATISYIEFLQNMNNDQQSLTAETRKKFAENLVVLFPRLSAAQKRFVTSAGISWKCVQHSWSQLNSAKRREYRQVLAGKRLNVNIDRSVPSEMQAYKRMYSDLALLMNRGHTAILDGFTELGRSVDYWAARVE